MRNVEIYLNEAMRDVALEIRTVDVLELVSNIHADKLGNIGDIVHSALELHFKPNAVCFGYSGSVQLGWFGKPSVSLDLELHCTGVDAYFCLIVDAMGSSVVLKHLSIDGEPDVGNIADRLQQAVEHARLNASAPWGAVWRQVAPGQHGLN